MLICNQRTIILQFWDKSKKSHRRLNRTQITSPTPRVSDVAGPDGAMNFHVWQFPRQGWFWCSWTGMYTLRPMKFVNVKLSQKNHKAQREFLEKLLCAWLACCKCCQMYFFTVLTLCKLRAKAREMHSETYKWRRKENECEGEDAE